MSRCFPFPPPGYELKLRSDDVDLLAKEKHKEKDKKEKRNKKKRKDKERKDKDRSKDKNKEKKHGKDKHREKKRHKDRDRDKSSFNERTKEKAQGHNKAEVDDYSRKVEEVNYSNFTEELSRRFRDDVAANRMSEIVNDPTHNGFSGLETWSSSEKERINHKELLTIEISTKQNRIDAPAEDADHKTPGNEIRDSSCLLSNHISREQREYGVGLPLGDCIKRIEQNEKNDSYKMVAKLGHNNQRRNDTINKPVEDTEVRITKKMLFNIIGREQRRNEGLGQQAQNNADKGINGKDKAKERKANDGKSNNDMHRDQEEKKRKRKDKDRHKKEKKEKKRDRHEHKHKKHKSSKDIVEKGQVDCLASDKDNEECAADEENCRKRKDHFKNGLLNENHLQPGKLPKLVASLPSHVEKGMNLATTFSSRKLSGANSKIDEHRASDSSGYMINDGGSLTSVDLGPPTGADTSRNDEASVRSPHPDSKYLDMIYSVPHMEDLFESIDQDWLFHNNVCQPKLKTDMKIDETIPHVWSEALKIESADVLALPYVVPY